MTEIINAIILGLVQGLTEFLPISSSGHLAILHKILNFETESNLFFDIILHLATLFAVIIFYRNEIVNISIAGKNSFSDMIFKKHSFKQAFWKEKNDSRLFVLIIIGSIPTGVIGIVFKDQVELLADNLLFVGYGLLFAAFMLLLFELKRRAFRKIPSMGIFDSIIIGTMQGVAIIPGISRSGSTIAIAKLLGIDKESAAKYSFLLSIPAITGAFLLKIKDIFSESIELDYLLLSVGFVASFLSGYYSLKLLIWLIKKANLRLFIIYCAIVGSTVVYYGLLK